MILAKLKLWGLCILGVLAGIAVVAFCGYYRGKAHAAKKVRQAKQRAASERAARQAYTDATLAAQAVEHTAQAQPPPDTQARDDFDSTF